MAAHVWTRSDDTQTGNVMPQRLQVSYRCTQCNVGPIWVSPSEDVESVAMMAYENYRQQGQKKDPAATRTRRDEVMPIPEACG